VPLFIVGDVKMRVFTENGNGYVTEEERAGLGLSPKAIAAALVVYPFVVPSYEPPEI
jgi:hypothetical protein